jgi:predicted nucleic acid-binding protein
MKVLLDVNIVLDVLLQRQPWLADAEAIWDAASDGRLNCCLCGSSLTDIFYIARKLVGQDPAREIVRKCLDNLTILTVDHRALEDAHARPEGDFEDAMQIAVAIHAGVDAIVTRDLTGFANSPVPVWSPTAFPGNRFPVRIERLDGQMRSVATRPA